MGAPSKGFLLDPDCDISGALMSELSFLFIEGWLSNFCINKRYLWLSHTFPALKPLLSQSCGRVLPADRFNNYPIKEKKKKKKRVFFQKSYF